MNKLHSADQMTVRQLNTSLILSCLRYESSLTRAKLAQQTGLNRSTVTNLVDDLIKQGLVIEMGAQPSKGGRPGIALSLNPDGGASIGIEIKDSFISVVLTDFLANIVWRETVEFPNPDKHIAFEVLFPKIEGLILRAIEASKELPSQLLGIGVGLTGLVNVATGVSVHAPNLGWRNLPIKEILEERFDLPVFVGNGASLAALSERHYGASLDVQNSIYIATSHIGVGGGFFLNNQLFHGASGYAGEIGHMVVNPHGDRCGCGRIGCWETEIGELHVAQRIAKRLKAGETSSLAQYVTDDLDNLTLPVILQAAQQNDTLAMDALDRLCQMLGLGIANLVNIFNPQLIILGGVFNRLSSLEIEKIKHVVNSEAMGGSTMNLDIIPSKLSMKDACVLGAAALVLDDILRAPSFQAIR